MSDHTLAENYVISQMKDAQLATEIEPEIPREFALLFTDLIDGDLGDLPKDSIAVFKLSKKKRLEPVIEKEADELSKENLLKHRNKVDKAILKELKNWLDLGALQKRLRKGCANLMTARWVIRWKRMADGSLEIGARFCIRGFQDLKQDTLKTYSATASRQGQRLINFIAASRRDFVLFSCDVGSACLKGLISFRSQQAYWRTFADSAGLLTERQSPTSKNF